MTNTPAASAEPSGLSVTRRIKRLTGGALETCSDELAIEEPLEIQVVFGPANDREARTISVTMRTPGHDRELAAGFLVGEGILRGLDQLDAVRARGPRNRVQVSLRPGVPLDLQRLDRNCYTTSSCGVCGKTSIEALRLNAFTELPPPEWRADEQIVKSLPARLREAQAAFRRTGGLHAAGLFTPLGEPIVVREDVGRHNAVDKVIGTQFLEGRGLLANTILVVSGRASFELVQKALAAGIPMLVAVGAPSSLAVQVAEQFAATLIGFTKPDGFNIYTGAARVHFSL